MRQRGGCLWFLVGLFLALIAGGLAFTAMFQATSAEQPAARAEPQAPVVIVARDVPPRTEITPEDLITKEMPLSAIPDNAVREQNAAIGKVTASQLIAGEILLNPRIAEPGQQRGPHIIFKTEPGKVVMAFPANDYMGKTGVLQPGDIIDILYSIEVERTKIKPDGELDQDKETVTFWTLQKVPITAVVLPLDAQAGTTQAQAGVAPQSILLALDPQDALLLKHLEDTEGIVDIVLRDREDNSEYETEPVNPRYLQDAYDITPEQLP